MPATSSKPSPPEIDALLAGAGAPSAQDLAERTDRREAAATLQPPFQLEPRPTRAAEPLPPTVARLAAARDLYWGRAAGRSPDGCLGWASVARSRGAGPASSPRPATSATSNPVTCSSRSPPAPHSTAFPLVAAVATAEGGAFSHAAILSREYAVPAVVGVAGLLDEVHDGDLVEVDPGAGAVRVIARAGAA